MTQMVVFTAGEQELGLWLVGLKRDHVAAMHRVSIVEAKEDLVEAPDGKVNVTICCAALIGFCSCLTGVFVWTAPQLDLLFLCFIAWACRLFLSCIGTLTDYALLTAVAYCAAVFSDWCLPVTMLCLCGYAAHFEQYMLAEAAQLGAHSSILLRKCWISKGIGMVSGASTGMLFVWHIRSVFWGCAVAWLCVVLLLPCRKHVARLQLSSWPPHDWAWQPHTQQNLISLVMWTALPSIDHYVIGLLSPVWLWVMLSGSAAAWFVGSKIRCLSVRCWLIVHALLSMAPKLLLMSVPYAQTVVATTCVLKSVARCAVMRHMIVNCIQHCPIGAEHQCVALVSTCLCLSALMSILSGAYVFQQSADLPFSGLMCGTAQLILLPLVLKARSAVAVHTGVHESQSDLDSECSEECTKVSVARPSDGTSEDTD